MTFASYRGHSTTLVGMPAALLVSVDFNDYPLPLHISGTREANSSLFKRLAQINDSAQAAACFQDYMDALLGLAHHAVTETSL